MILYCRLPIRIGSSRRLRRRRRYCPASPMKRELQPCLLIIQNAIRSRMDRIGEGARARADAREKSRTRWTGAEGRGACWPSTTAALGAPRGSRRSTSVFRRRSSSARRALNKHSRFEKKSGRKTNSLPSVRRHNVAASQVHGGATSVDGSPQPDCNASAGKTWREGALRSFSICVNSNGRKRKSLMMTTHWTTIIITRRWRTRLICLTSP